MSKDTTMVAAPSRRQASRSCEAPVSVIAVLALAVCFGACGGSASSSPARQDGGASPSDTAGKSAQDAGLPDTAEGATVMTSTDGGPKHDNSDGSASSASGGRATDAATATPDALTPEDAAVTDGATGAADAQVPAPLTCYYDGQRVRDGGVCCNDDPSNDGICGGCLGEGELANTNDSCCNSLQKVNGYCGTNACAWEGEPCVGDGGKMCCLDDCNAAGRCGPWSQ